MLCRFFCIDKQIDAFHREIIKNCQSIRTLGVNKKLLKKVKRLKNAVAKARATDIANATRLERLNQRMVVKTESSEMMNLLIEVREKRCLSIEEFNLLSAILMRIGKLASEEQDMILHPEIYDIPIEVKVSANRTFSY